jgi:hypothetical protein
MTEREEQIRRMNGTDGHYALGALASTRMTGGEELGTALRAGKLKGIPDPLTQVAVRLQDALQAKLAEAKPHLPRACGAACTTGAEGVAGVGAGKGSKPLATAIARYSRLLG